MIRMMSFNISNEREIDIVICACRSRRDDRGGRGNVGWHYKYEINI